MTAAFTALLPVFLVIMLGAALRRSRLVDEKHWLAMDQLCYLVLFPALIFKEIAAADFSSLPVWTASCRHDGSGRVNHGAGMPHEPAGEEACPPWMLDRTARRSTRPAIRPRQRRSIFEFVSIPRSDG